jgi:hypothetical protein
MLLLLLRIGKNIKKEEEEEEKKKDMRKSIA